jgi:YD repeat-containing protein
VTNFTYDDAKRRVMMKDPAAFSTSFELDPQSRLISQTRYTTTQTQGTTPPSEITRYAYVGTSQQLASLTTPQGSTTAYQYNNVYGLCTRVTAPNGQVTAYSYTNGDLSTSMESDLEAKMEDTEERKRLEKTALLDDFTKRPNCTSIARRSAEDLPGSSKTTRFVYDVQDLIKTEPFVRYKISPTGCVTEYQPDAKRNVASERLYHNAAFDLSPFILPHLIPAMDSMQRWLYSFSPPWEKVPPETVLIGGWMRGKLITSNVPITSNLHPSHALPSTATTS